MLVLPEDLFDQVKSLADERGVAVVAVLREFIGLGLLAEKIKKSPDSELLIKEGETVRQILLH